MTTRAGRAECGDCGASLPAAAETPAPCPACGSRRRNAFAFAETATGLGKANDAGTLVMQPRSTYHNGRQRKPALERRTGTSMSVDGVERFRRQLFDRENDWYEEEVLDPDGSVNHFEASPLSEHWGRGSDKRRRRPEV